LLVKEKRHKRGDHVDARANRAYGGRGARVEQKGDEPKGACGDGDLERGKEGEKEWELHIGRGEADPKHSRDEKSDLINSQVSKKGRGKG